MAKKKAKRQRTVGKGEQMPLIDVGPKHSEEMDRIATQYKALIKKRLALQAKEAELKADVRALIMAEELTRLKDGSIKCRSESWIFELKPTDEKLTVTAVKK